MRIIAEHLQEVNRRLNTVIDGAIEDRDLYRKNREFLEAKLDDALQGVDPVSAQTIKGLFKQHTTKMFVKRDPRDKMVVRKDLTK